MNTLIEVQRDNAAELLHEAEAALRSVEATCRHNSHPEWAEALITCRKNVEAAREALAEFDRAVGGAR